MEVARTAVGVSGRRYGVKTCARGGASISTGSSNERKLNVWVVPRTLVACPWSSSGSSCRLRPAPPLEPQELLDARGLERTVEVKPLSAPHTELP